MFARIIALSMIFALTGTITADAQITPPANTGGHNWRRPGPPDTDRDAQAGAADAVSPADRQLRPTPPITEVAARPATRPRRGTGSLPNDQGQIWREYDISPYTRGATSVAKPQKSIVDWILRDTGFEAWHSDTVAILSADSRTLRVYHTPAMHRTVADIVDRYVSSTARSYMYGLTICTVGHPDWRSRDQGILQPVAVQAQGVEAWLVAREDAATLKENLARRTDHTNHGSPRMLINNGQNAAVTFNRQRSYARSLSAPSGTPTANGEKLDQISEGVTVELNPLMSLDGKTVDALIQCNVIQVERLVPVRLQAPGAAPRSRQLYSIEVPQISSRQFQERFRWPKEKVLVVSLGMAPRPLPHLDVRNPLKLPISSVPPRGDLLLLVEHKGDAIQAETADGSAVLKTQNYRGRY